MIGLTRPMVGWLWMAGAILTEIIATAALTYSQGLTRAPVVAVTAALYVASYVCLARALHAGVEVSVGYAVWSGVGTAALAVIGAALFGEALTASRIAAIVLIICGVVLLQLTATPASAQPARVQSTPPSAALAADGPPPRSP
ncbi:small multidrug resistance pump [Actinoplanes campanulatus]|uniref:Small multidrug resistance pump n=1 Tax=Actinoplanes campanulatus TaxID=113559 RepID=A0A7W5AK87_9ACTN|nr:multidrug efflux SMR transporter [Actinoplanes campanulatus]MBB3097828.1 small multidrug resistance pump [Actinoplanes campanulatus]